MTAFISIRVSTREQARDGTSLPSQIRECMAYCAQSDLSLSSHSNVNSPGIFCDPGVSAWKIPIFERPGFNALWHHVQPGDSIVFLSFDRAFRSTRDFLQSWEVFKARRVNPIFVRNDIRMDTAAGQLWARTIASFAEYQSAVLSERVLEANAIRRQYGITKPPKSAKSTSITEIPPDIRSLYSPRDVNPAAAAKKGRVFAYARVSTTDQDAEPQIRRLESGIEYRTINGYTRGGLFLDEGVSAFYHDFANRPAGAMIWSQLQRGDVIICTKLDRIFRSTQDMANALTKLTSIGVTITTLDGSISTETPEGQAIASYLCIMAQWESQSISWRTKLALDSIRRERGPWLDMNRLPQWIQRIHIDGDRYRLQIRPEIVRDVITMKNLQNDGFSLNEISDVLQRQHEAEYNLPIEIPRLGFESRFQLENRLRTKHRDKLAAVQKYCEYWGIKHKDPVDRHYSINREDIIMLSKYADEDSLFTRYMEQNEADHENIFEAVGAI